MVKKLDCLKLINFIENSADFKDYIIPCKKILIAYSGGQDSSSLLAIFYILSKKWKFQLGVVYCNHGWVKSTDPTLVILNVIQNYKLPVYYVDTDPRVIKKPEMIARQWRYQAFEQIKIQGKYDLLLTGHTLSDKAETLLFNLARGCGLKGVSALKSVQYFSYTKKDHTANTFHFNYQIFELNDFMCYFEKFRQTKKYQVPIYRKNSTRLRSFLHLTNAFNLYFLQCYLKKISCQWSPYSSYENKKVFGNQTKVESLQIFSLITFFNPVTYLTAKKMIINLELKQNMGLKLSEIGYNSNMFNNLTIIKQRFKVFQTIKNKKSIFFDFYTQKNRTENYLKKKKNPQLSEKLIILMVKKSNETINSNEIFLHEPIKNFIYNPRNTNIYKNRGIEKIDSKSFLIVRPLLKIDRATINLFVENLQLLIYLDSSNLDVDLTRNFIRHKVIPLLKEINPKTEQNFYKFAQIANLYYRQYGEHLCQSDEMDFFRP